MQKLKNFIKKWIVAIRAPFFTASAIPVLVGTALAWNLTGKFSLYKFILTLIGVPLFNAGTNLANDYYDHKTGNDEINTNLTPFSGGSRVIQNGLIPPKHILIGSFLFFGLGSIIGLYLNAITPGNFILFLGIFGLLSGFLYTFTPILIGYRGWGEFLVGLNLGTLTIIGAYYVHTHTLSWAAFWVSLPIGFLVAAILYINQFPDYEADKAVNKRHWVVILGKKNAVYGYYFLILANYLVIVFSVIFKVITPFALAPLLTLPLALGAVKVLRVNYDKVAELIPAQAMTVKMHLLVGLLLSLGFVVGRIV
ncbi:MAG: 1,4-dihydroxy-2-naphthoate octaprenyltransferase [candidate division Zixibacteria bacterium]|nr:1,4-dihydroxy-2-naphthoate octaprenyltransferase [candidate division Zixibacteria bacterium]